ncbi:MAG TPA: hypothetical protein VMU01_14460 [Rhizomicrobium sp.]|nr:hypothetical protein [Rhizomicrobium sp.]
MRTIAAAIGLAAVAAASSAAGPRTFEMRFVAACTPQTQVYALVGTGEQLCFSDEHILSAASVLRARRGAASGIVDLDITPTASETLHDAAIDDPERRIGILFGDRLIYAAEIAAPLRAGFLELDLGNDPDDIDALVSAFPGKEAAE